MTNTKLCFHFCRLRVYVLLGGISLCFPAVPASGQGLQLIPQPREFRSKPQKFAVTPSTAIYLVGAADDEDRRAAASLQHELKLSTGRDFPVLSSPQAPAADSAILLGRLDQPTVQTLLSSLTLSSSGVGDQGYVLDVEPGRVLVAGKNGPGLFYGVQTLRQLMVGTGSTEILGVRIRDWPAMKYRGVLIDLSRGPVPNLSTLTQAVDTLAEFKINQIYFHMEDSWRSPRQPLIGLLSDTLSLDEWKQLVAHAQSQNIDIIPEQEACGHLHKILRFEQYSGLAERDRGHVLAPPVDGSYKFVDDLFGEMTPFFPSPFFHIGCDETWELGRGRSKALVEKETAGKAYIDNLKRVYSLAQAHGKRVVFWGDIALNRPDLLKELPKDIVVATWEYFPHDDYKKWLKPFQDARLEIIVCPWVGNTNLIFNDYESSAVNIQRFVRDGQKAGAAGMMNTSWNDDGETLLGMNWYGYVLGAACSWQVGECNVEDFNDRFDWAFFRNTDHRFSQAILDLSSINRLIRSAGAGSVYTPEVGGTADSLFWQNPFEGTGPAQVKMILPVAEQVRTLAEKSYTTLKLGGYRAARRGELLEHLEFAAMKLDALGLRYQVASDMAKYYRAAYIKYPAKPQSDDEIAETSDLGEIEGTNGRLQDLREYAVVLRAMYKRLWLSENRPGWLPNMLTHWDDHIAMLSDQIRKHARIRREYQQGVPLPPPESLGLIDAPVEGRK